MKRAKSALYVILSLMLVGTAVVMSAFAAGTTDATVVDNVRWIHAQINDWRIGRDLAPLITNETLTHMAQDQAEYLALLASRGVTPSNVHAGRNGEGPRERALYADYDWDTYGAPAQIVLGEIAWIGDREDALAFWNESSVHRQTATNGWYREIGIGEVPQTDGTGSFFVVVMGARPNVLPALADPENEQLYLTNETYTRGVGNWIRNVTQVQFFDQYGRPLGEEQGWVAKMPLPDAADDALFVLYSDNLGHEVMTAVTLNESEINLPAYEDQWATATPELVITPTTAPTATPLPIPHIQLHYDPNSLTLVNTANIRANVSRLTLVSDVSGSRLPVTTLNAGFGYGTLAALPRGNCVQFALQNRRFTTPGVCTYNTITYAQPSQLVWLDDFSVELDGSVIATCKSGDGLCEFDLP
jgi:hypothetical protein